MLSFITRLISGAMLLPAVCYAVFAGGYIYQALLFIWAALAVYEWFKMCVKSDLSAMKANTWFVCGCAYILISIWGVHNVRAFSSIYSFEPYVAQMLLIILIATVDSSAYVAGKTFKGPKLAPAVSPNKTWTGAIGALFSAVIFAYFSLYYQFGFISMWNDKFCIQYTALCVSIALISQIGDLLESFAKRCFGVKDSGSIIPGHGGVLDRTDGLITVGFVLAIIFLCF